MNSVRTIAAWLTLGAAFALGSAGAESLAPLARGVGGAAAAIKNGELWVVGGSFWENGTKRIDSAIRRRALTGTDWELIGEIPGGFAHGGWAATDGALFLAGGINASGATAAVWRIDLPSGKVTKFAELPAPRAHCGAAIFDDQLWIVGGSPVDGDFTQTSRACWQVNLRSGAATTTPEGPALVSPLVLALGDELHVLPGGTWSSGQNRLEAPTSRHVFSKKSRQWQTRPLSGPLPRGLSGVALDAHRVWLCGGAHYVGGEVTITRDTWIFDVTTNALTAGPLLPAPRYAAAILRSGPHILLIGGEDRPRERAATIWRISPEERP